MEFRLSQWHIVAANLLLVIGITYFATQIVNQIIRGRLAEAPEAPAAVQSRIVAANHSREQYNTIAKRDIFNLEPRISAPVVARIDLHLKLLGISTLTRSAPFAIIEDQGGNQDLWKLGEDIPDAGKLVAIEKTRVVIDHQGQLVALDLPANEAPEESPPTRGFAGLPMPTITPPESNDSDDVDVNVDETSPNHYSVSRGDLRNALRHTSQLMTQIHATPNIQNGRPNGLNITEVEPGSVFEDLGLEDGDLLNSIDGRPLVNPAEAIGLLSTLPARQSVEISVTRDGDPVTLHYDIH